MRVENAIKTSVLLILALHSYG